MNTLLYIILPNAFIAPFFMNSIRKKYKGLSIKEMMGFTLISAIPVILPCWALLSVIDKIDIDWDKKRFVPNSDLA